jgi:hypothetical protein
MSVDLAHPAAEKIVLVLEGIGDDKIRVNSSSLDHPSTILPDQTIEIVAIVSTTIRPGWSRRVTVRRPKRRYTLCNGVTVPETALLKRRYGFVTVFQCG